MFSVTVSKKDSRKENGRGNSSLSKSWSEFDAALALKNLAGFTCQSMVINEDDVKNEKAKTCHSALTESCKYAACVTESFSDDKNGHVPLTFPQKVMEMLDNKDIIDTIAW
eukprot:CAMPEP_0195512996 /NCGR_PEP_ID=MMETSP0794_2-20130614/4759_1 /TAXON_ID=515487 /ORGANISM="Stephanopyxis turris, Strain CCMP 815" /LENGTH=110 /DNA_ID=CAMNT_0040640897 /DNA_START=1 /DNA_END=330 /DNA_ORIENTATION=+